MSQGNIYKPRYSFRNRSQSKIWFYKNSYLRRFYERRSRRVKRGGLFRRAVLVANNRKWTIARRNMRPARRRAGRSVNSARTTVYGRPLKRRYLKSFQQKQQLRVFYGMDKEKAFRSFFTSTRAFQGIASSSFFSVLESRLDRTLYRRRLFPTLFACRQYIYHHGVLLNGGIELSPRSSVQTGDSIEIPISVWKQLYWDLFCRIYFRRWGLFIFSRRFYSRFKKKIFKLRWQSFRPFHSKLESLKWYSSTSGLARADLISLSSKKANFLPKQSVWKTRRLSSEIASSRGSSLLAATKQTAFINRRRDGPGWLNKFRDRFLREKHNLSDKAGNKSIKKTSSRRLFRRYFSKIVSLRDMISPTTRVYSARSDKYTSGVLDTVNYSSKNKKYIKSLVGSYRPKGGVSLYAKVGQTIEQLNSIISKKEAFFNINSDINTTSRKNKQLVTFFYSQQLRNYIIPRYKSLNDFSKIKSHISHSRIKRIRKRKSFFKKRIRSFRRQISRFVRRWHFYSVRNRKFIRIKPVHLSTSPSFQYDFRTLRRIKIASASSDQIYTGFRLSPSKVYSYYKSRGF